MQVTKVDKLEAQGTKVGGGGGERAGEGRRAGLPGYPPPPACVPRWMDKLEAQGTKVEREEVREGSGGCRARR